MNEMTHDSMRIDHIVLPPRILIYLDLWQKIMAYTTAACPVEINGLGEVYREENNFLIRDVFILGQEVSLTSADTDDAALHRYLYGCVSRGKTVSDIRLQWHSHPDDVFCSDKDIRTIEGYMSDYMISLVVNRFGQHHCRLDLFKPFRIGLIIPLTIILPAAAPDIITRCRAEIRDVVKIKGLPAAAKEPLCQLVPLDETVISDGKRRSGDGS